MKHLLIPSRHIIYSKDQYQALVDHLRTHTYEYLIFVVTSSNLNNCKYSPISLQYRIMMIDHLVFQLKKEFNVSYKIVCLPHYNHVSSFAERIIKSVAHAVDLEITKETVDVFTFGAYVGQMFSENGYTTFTKTGVDHIALFKELFENNNENYFYEQLSESSKEVITNQQEIITEARKIWLDTILKEKGSITENRNYNTYAIDMSNKDMLEVKYNDIKDYIVDGKITDEGCADAALFIPIARDFPDSDLVGVDISNDFIARANENIRRGLFGGSFVSIVQANLMEKIFEDETISTTICNSTMHEVWSYNNKLESVEDYLRLKQKQLLRGGRILIRDVIGPLHKDRAVYIRSLEDTNHENFKKFLQDFKHIRDIDTPTEVTINEHVYYTTTLKLASEYLLHKDYHDNWESEMHEEFCHFSVDDWRDVLLKESFKIVSLHSYRSEWIHSQRYNGKVELLDENKNVLDFPDTNVVIVAEK